MVYDYYLIILLNTLQASSFMLPSFVDKLQEPRKYSHQIATTAEIPSAINDLDPSCAAVNTGSSKL